VEDTKCAYCQAVALCPVVAECPDIFLIRDGGGVAVMPREHRVCPADLTEAEHAQLFAEAMRCMTKLAGADITPGWIMTLVVVKGTNDHFRIHLGPSRDHAGVYGAYERLTLLNKASTAAAELLNAHNGFILQGSVG